MLVTAPEHLRTEPRRLTLANLVRRAAGFRSDDVASATKLALRSVAHAVARLEEPGMVVRAPHPVHGR